MEKNIRFYLFLWNSKEKKKEENIQTSEKARNFKMHVWHTEEQTVVICFQMKKDSIYLKKFWKKKIQSVQKRKKFPNACVIYCNFVLKVNLNDSSLTCICLSYRICSLYWDSTANKDHTTIVEHTHSASQITECSQLNFI